MSAEDDVIAVVDDNDVIREALDRLLVAAGYRTELYASAEEFLRAATATRAACLMVDVELGGTSGPQLLRNLAARGLRFPAILMSASGDPAAATRRRRARLPDVPAQAVCADGPAGDARADAGVRQQLTGRAAARRRRQA